MTCQNFVCLSMFCHVTLVSPKHFTFALHSSPKDHRAGINEAVTLLFPYVFSHKATGLIHRPLALRMMLLVSTIRLLHPPPLCAFRHGFGGGGRQFIRYPDYTSSLYTPLTKVAIQQPD